MGDIAGGSGRETAEKLIILHELGWSWDELATIINVSTERLLSYVESEQFPVKALLPVDQFFRGQTENQLCKYNHGVGCDKYEQCAECGWNPAVAKEREELWRKQEYIPLKSQKSTQRTVTYEPSSRTIYVLMTYKC